jgi:predicted SnoaL-like aldol condensation-catalyzing enzyme
MNIEEKKSVATRFLHMSVEGRAHEGVKMFFSENAKHHNAYFPAGMHTLADAMEANAREYPNKGFEIKHVVGEGDLVAVHSHVVLKPKELEVATVHLFRFESDKVAEFWDIGQIIPENNPNADGIF